MSDSLRRAGGGRGWRLLARTLVVAGAAAAGTSAGWFAHAGADPAVLDLPGPVLAAPDDSVAEPDVESGPADRPGPSSPQHPVGTVVHHITEPLARAAAPEPASDDEAPSDTASGDGDAAAEAGSRAPDESEVDESAPASADDPGRFSLDALAPQRLVGRVAEAEPVTTVVHGAGSLLAPVRGALVPEPGAERPGPPLSGLTRPVANGIHQLASPLWNHTAPESPTTVPPASAETAPAAELPQAPQRGSVVRALPNPPVPASSTIATFTVDESHGTATGSPVAPREDRPWTPGKAATPPLPANGASGHAGDGSGGPGGVGLTWPMESSAAHLAELRSLDRTAISAPGSAFAASPGATPD